MLKGDIMNKTCSICGTEKDVKEFEKKYDGSPGRRRSYCKQCHLDKIRKKRNECSITWKEWAGGECVRCKYNKCPAALEFHHRDPATKECMVSKLTRHGSNPGSSGKIAELARIEIAKCDLVCANCHREIHSNCTKHL
jgi:hypothetical protein